MKLLTQKLQLRQEAITLQTLNVFHCFFIVFCVIVFLESLFYLSHAFLILEIVVILFNANKLPSCKNLL